MYVVYLIFAIAHLTFFVFTEDIVNGIFTILFTLFIVEQRITKAIEGKR